MPAVLNAANEVAVQAFLDGKIGFTTIPQIIERAMNQSSVTPLLSIDDVFAADQAARRIAEQLIAEPAAA